MEITLRQLHQVTKLLKGDVKRLTVKTDDLKKTTTRLENKIDDGLARQFGHFDRRFNDMQKQFDTFATKDDVNKILIRIDEFVNRSSQQEIETAALVSQTRRHELWIQKMARSMAHYLKMP